MCFLVLTVFFVYKLFLGYKRPLQRYHIFMNQPSLHELDFVPIKQAYCIQQYSYVLELFCSKMQPLFYNESLLFKSSFLLLFLQILICWILTSKRSLLDRKHLKQRFLQRHKQGLCTPNALRDRSFLGYDALKLKSLRQ